MKRPLNFRLKWRRVEIFKTNLFRQMEKGFRFLLCPNGLETKISTTFLDFLHLGHEFFVILSHGT